MRKTALFLLLALSGPLLRPSWAQNCVWELDPEQVRHILGAKLADLPLVKATPPEGQQKVLGNMVNAFEPYVHARLNVASPADADVVEQAYQSTLKPQNRRTADQDKQKTDWHFIEGFMIRMLRKQVAAKDHTIKIVLGGTAPAEVERVSVLLKKVFMIEGVSRAGWKIDIYAYSIDFRVLQNIFESVDQNLATNGFHYHIEYMDLMAQEQFARIQQVRPDMLFMLNSLNINSFFNRYEISKHEEEQLGRPDENHLPIEEVRKQLLRVRDEAYDALKPGGLLIVEEVTSYPGMPEGKFFLFDSYQGRAHSGLFMKKQI